MTKLPKELFSIIRKIQMQTTHLADDVLGGAYHSAFKGRGMEFEEVREYQLGDEVRSIDWNVTARMNHPYVKLFKEERELSVLLVVDVSASLQFGKKEQKKNELIAETAALLAFSAVKNGDKIALILFSNKIEMYLPPKKGLRHILRVIRELLYYQPTQSGTNVGQALAFAGNIHRKKSICFVLSDFLAPPFERDWALVAKRHDLIAVHIADSYENQFPSLGLVAMQDLESKAEKTIDTSSQDTQDCQKENREKTYRQIKALSKKYGTGLIELSTGTPPLKEIKKFFKLRGRRCR